MASMEKEDFWGCEIGKASSEVRWDPQFEDSQLGEVEHKLVLSQACLGNKAQGRSVIEVTAMDFKGDQCTHTIVSLRQGSTEMCPLNLAFSPPVIFKLAEGAGPVHLTGNHVQSLMDESSDSDSEEQTPETLEKIDITTKKRPLPSSTPKEPPKKLAKVLTEDYEEEGSDEDDSEDDEDEAEDESMEVHIAKKQTKQVPVKKKEDNKLLDKAAEEDSSEDDSDFNEDEEDDDEDDKSDEESDEEEEESEDEVTNTLTGKKKGGDTKKPVTNGVSSNKAASKKTDKQTEGKKTPQQKQKPAGKGVTPSSPKDISSIKQALLKSPALPKKIDKFKNLMKSSYKITDEGVVTDVWDFLQKNKK